MKRRMISVVAVMALVPMMTSCNLSRRDKGAAIGATAGGAAGAVVGNATGSTARGAIIGAVIGGVAGGVIGHQMDQQAKELTYALPGAVVTRLGEGITVTFPEGLLFAFDSDVVSTSARDNLIKLATSMSKYDHTNAMIVGHTDSKGTADYNMGLSERRARAAADFLSLQGISRARMGTIGRGATEALASNATDAGRTLNRRIEIAIYADEAFRRQAQSSN
jgi:outer membrane protein OmpA-like peptidoglycan-associated protein